MITTSISFSAFRPSESLTLMVKLCLPFGTSALRTVKESALNSASARILSVISIKKPYRILKDSMSMVASSDVVKRTMMSMGPFMSPPSSDGDSTNTAGAGLLLWRILAGALSSEARYCACSCSVTSVNLSEALVVVLESSSIKSEKHNTVHNAVIENACWV